MPLPLIVRHLAASRNDSVAEPQWLPNSNSLSPVSADYATSTETMKPPGLTAYVSSVASTGRIRRYISGALYFSYYSSFHVRSSCKQSDWLRRLFSSISISSLFLLFSPSKDEVLNQSFTSRPGGCPHFSLAMGTTRLLTGPSWPIPVSLPQAPPSYGWFNRHYSPIPVLRYFRWLLSYGDWIPHGYCRYGWYRITFRLFTYPIVRGSYLPVGSGSRDPIQDGEAGVQSSRPLWWTSFSSVLPNSHIRRPYRRPNPRLRDRL